MAHVNCEPHIDSVTDVQWREVCSLSAKELAFDHRQIIQLAHERLQQKALYSIVPAYALPNEFTFTELQGLHEVIIGTTLEKNHLGAASKKQSY